MNFLKGLPVLDFAFAIHTELGFCIGAKINEEVVGVDKIIQNGETVHILKSPKQEPVLNGLNL